MSAILSPEQVAGDKAATEQKTTARRRWGVRSYRRSLVFAWLRWSRWPALVVMFAFPPASSPAQELEPRAYSPSPTGTNFLLGSYVHTTGDVVFDPSLPVKNVTAKVSSTVLAYGRTFGLLGRSASAALLLPYAWGTMSGDVAEEYRSIERSGLADMRARVTVNLLGGPALTPQEFARRTPRTLLGTSLIVVAPTGEYDATKLINISANRWAVKSELGLAVPVDRLTLEAYAAVWLFTDNADFYGGSRREQAPLASFQVHVGYTFKPRLWLAADATYYGGGNITIDGVETDGTQRNSRGGLTLSAPVGRRSSLKATWSQGFVARVGGDFSTYGLALQTVWF
jgi:hypothetical protein